MGVQLEFRLADSAFVAGHEELGLGYSCPGDGAMLGDLQGLGLIVLHEVLYIDGHSGGGFGSRVVGDLDRHGVGVAVLVIQLGVSLDGDSSVVDVDFVFSGIPSAQGVDGCPVGVAGLRQRVTYDWSVGDGVLEGVEGIVFLVEGDLFVHGVVGGRHRCCPAPTGLSV